MKLEELMDVMNEEQTVKIFDSNDDFIAMYDGRDSVPAVFNDVEITYVIANSGTFCVHTNYDNNLKAIDYLKDRLADIAEVIACDEYHFDSPDIVNQRIMDGLANVADDIGIIRANIASKLPWDSGMYI